MSNQNNPTLTITLTNGSVMTGELYPDIAPNTVDNFIALSNSGFYDGLTFHRVIKNFMLQGGCPEGSGMGGPGYCVKGEFNRNGFENNLKHTKGVLSMARSGHPDSAGSQFFIMHKESPHLDGEYAAFGLITGGTKLIDEIADVETDYSDRPKETVIIKEIRVDTHGVDYPNPEKA